MPPASLSIKQHGLAVSLVTALSITACGGSFDRGDASGAGAGTTAGAAGSGSPGGAGGSACYAACPANPCFENMVPPPGNCCPICEPAGGSGGVSSAGSGGAPSAGSGNVGGFCTIACPAIACPAGDTYVTLSGACCPTCVPTNCETVDCAAPACAPGYSPQTVPDRCCPVCLPNTACINGQQGYNALRTKLLAQPGAVACKVDADCTFLGNNRSCGDVCNGAPVSGAAAPGINAALLSFAEQNCSTCSVLQPPCPSPASPACVANQCTFGMFSSE